MNNTVIISPDVSRADYDRMLRTLGINPSNFLITQDTLRIEAVLNPANNSYRLNLYENPGSDRPLEKKLNRNDVFAATHIGLGVTKYDPTTTPEQYGNTPVLFSEDGNYFAGNNGESAALLTIWNSFLNIKTSTVDRLQNFKTDVLRYNPERGYQILSAPQTADEYPQYGGDGGMDSKGFFKITPNIIFNGQQDNKIEIVLGAGNYAGIDGTVDSAGAAVTTRNVLVFYVHGFVIHEAANPALRWEIF